MIIETLTAFSAGRFVWETLEILHLIHVGKISGNAACKGVGSISHLMQEQINKWKKQINPGRQCEIEAKTPYYFTSIDDDNYQKTKEKADSYLTKLNHSVESLKNAKIYFLKIYKSVIQLAAKDKKTFLSNLLDFKIKFQSFKDELNQFLLSIEIPPRQLLYIANLSNQRSGSGELGVIEKFNGYLEDIKACFNEMEYTKKDMFDKLKEGFILNPESADLNLSEQFQHSIDQLSEIMPAIPQENTKYLTVREAMVEISAVFQQTDYNRGSG
ncbi:hypothetical protein [Rickettsiella massiliensis]|uniref:hypothetical protein n=1 Tax=Rickettsiella massiliensis TaxID=676517 RepID=UPI00029AD290|nr:hypothetical protein [Rickettsiella massiliensis]